MNNTRHSPKPDGAMQVNLIAPSSMSFVLVLAAKSNSDKIMEACAFCDAKIEFGESVCPNCMNKYNIKSYDLGSDGCGCDR
jgi:predicted amidophosphoribosyltransferase